MKGRLKVLRSRIESDLISSEGADLIDGVSVRRLRLRTSNEAAVIWGVRFDKQRGNATVPTARSEAQPPS
jgi:uncharacterized protein YihD (DUF1040 family)